MRSTFRDWAAEATNFPREIAEASLGHALESKVEAAYLRSERIEQRRVLMQAWADFTSKPPLDGKVLPMRRANV